MNLRGQVAWEVLPGEAKACKSWCEMVHISWEIQLSGNSQKKNSQRRDSQNTQNTQHWTVELPMIWKPSDTQIQLTLLFSWCSRSLNSPPLLMIHGLFKSLFTIVLFKGPKETRDVSTFLTFQLIWIFLCRFPYLEVHYSANCTLHCHQQSAPSPQISAYFAIFSF